MEARANRMFQNLDAANRKLIEDANTRVMATSELLMNMSGSTDPFNLWDPWGLSVDLEEDALIFMRETELVHGRVGMIATLGLISGEVLSPVFGGKPGVPAAFAQECT